ncbi:MAG: ATP-binding protein [candidate division KSB1 bacterium]|nr:ATP-binding protein [candidate division KSB1 bacterium]MDZ7345368.1 ATP-binding protein [candidate division KSB1 bacterium]
MTKTIELRLISDPALLSAMRTAVASVCEWAGFDQRTTGRIVLALDEACTNIIKHAYKMQNDQRISIICRITPGKLVFILEDDGEPADIKKIKSRPLNEIRPGGLGVYLINSVMDKVRYKAGKVKGNRLYMHIRRPKGSAA